MKIRKICLMLGITLSCLKLAPSTSAQENEVSANSRPNVLIILVDDMGYSDIGAYGGEIRTPNIDRLAKDGVRLTHFHSAPSCSPTRAMLLSGANSHVAGLGAMVEHIPPHYRGREGFEGVLSTRVASLAERFGGGGYRTAMAGKWHLGMEPGQRPAQRGFDRSFALLQGAANHFGKGGFTAEEEGHGAATYLEDDKPYLPDAEFYSSDIFTEKLIDQLIDGDQAKPFFAYLSFSAPHSPLQAPAADIARYLSTYEAGWAKLTQERLVRMREAGVLPGDIPDSGVDIGPAQRSWDALTAEERARAAREMAVYAAMIDRIDQNVGRVIESLERSGQLDNTIILFMSDNGPAGENSSLYALMPGFTERYTSADHSLEAMGSAESFVLRDPHWASASAAPSSLFKGFVTQGGTLVPLIIKAPGLPAGGTSAVIGDMRDIAPTLLAMAGIQESTTVNGMSVARIEGENLMPWLVAGRDDRPIKHVALSLYGQGSVRAGAWKAIRLLPPMGDTTWNLYNTLEDPGERHDRKAEMPELFAAMMESWQAYVKEHGIDEVADLQPPDGVNLKH